MKWKTLSKAEAEVQMKTWFEQQSDQFDNDYSAVRSSLQNALKSAAFDLNLDRTKIQSAGYEFDLLFGIKLYEVLTKEFKMNPRLASNDGIWRYLSIKVIPDIVALRWGNNPDRFWKKNWRIWLKILWWYIYLSWQGDTEKTFKVLENNTSDEISQLVERSGSSGYRVELCREIMSYYSFIAVDKQKRNQKIFKRAMKLNTARAKVIEPSLFSGGERQYVKELFEYFG
ncbi:hypothetical protein [Paenibacillus lignilyticus]|uniref:Uncharacterized protein n=1 Tax=Paenibacillus lignilyticus TaxID=1172615 RepID=A0ABS5CK65_9BACL|nr:hypothetical protein [Paenibacillus lignilyticus]MBP3966253.1 hypothetical protein [Paenibacillus lignilyticus]